MKSVLFGALLCLSLASLASFSVRESEADPVAPVATRRGVIAFDDITLDRAFRVTIQVPGSAATTVFPMPSNLGVVIRELRPLSYPTPIVGLNGPGVDALGNPTPNCVLWNTNLASDGTLGPVTVFDPPLIVRPGETLHLSTNGGTSTGFYSIAGYTISPGDA